MLSLMSKLIVPLSKLFIFPIYGLLAFFRRKEEYPMIVSTI